MCEVKWWRSPLRRSLLVRFRSRALPKLVDAGLEDVEPRSHDVSDRGSVRRTLHVKRLRDRLNGLACALERRRDGDVESEARPVGLIRMDHVVLKGRTENRGPERGEGER